MSYIPLLLILFFLIILIIWWRNSITKSYLDKLHKQEIDLLEKQIEKQQITIKKLQDDNEHLAHTIHKDNKLIPSMESAVSKYLTNLSSMTSEESIQYGHILITELQHMYEERSALLIDNKKSGNTLCQSGLCSIDAILSYMHDTAAKEKIELDIEFSINIQAMVPNYISEKDLTHLLGDLLDNAIIATKSSTKKSIHVCFESILGCPAIEIMDTGIPFTPETLQNFGLHQHTTHISTGGSGIGLMDIWELKKKYQASIQITEYAPDKNLYSKKVAIIFDKKNDYLIQTYRRTELVSLQCRRDLYIFS